jgi:hypothetical protein
MAAYYRATIDEFLKANPAEILRSLHRESAGNFASISICSARRVGGSASDAENGTRRFDSSDTRCVLFGASFLEYDIPGRSKRLDAVILCERGIIPIEFKVGAAEFQSEDRWQLKVYSWNLRDFHRESRGRLIAPILVATEAPRSLRLEGELRATDRHGLLLKMQLARPTDLSLALQTRPCRDARRSSKAH